MKLLVLLLIIWGRTFASESTSTSCQINRSSELQTMVKASQDARKNFENLTKKQLQLLAKEDNARLLRIEEMVKEGCLTSAKDFAAAAMMFQYGTTSKHFLQSYLWAQKAIQLGDKNQKRLMALSIDRYLISINHQQIFASQAYKPDRPKNSCWCLEMVEKSFPDQLRFYYMGNDLNAQINW
ncbi:MAG: hypothetical protein A2381_13745 [Bdellovibrionales bacterium RIFOXYB1_FULL_37_110]|nr:MAG: hypothetical protein A2417_05380 [Bdellovibrionales bacterium RIFOXYC1_FULL_37_79]OFZ56924.1 MAG: hypothetical protein A2381_13745 [Bdellovibrionales bacterium RIFOXYB1_FULL_37_110]OFZ62011.1 MAG: hypothetical protein A2577_19215 [Bdellovibrionales bacterium RIFOXYD1_FULL_36_51]